MDIRISQALDDRVEEIATAMGTTKNSIIVVATAIFAQEMSGLLKQGKKLERVTVESALTELLGEA